MTNSPLAVSSGNSPKKSSRNGTRIDTFLVHHMAGTDGPGTTRMMLGSGGRTVSANYTIWNDGTIHQVVPEEFRAWTSGSASDGGKGAQWDRRSITVEIENETAGPDWRISNAALNAAAALFNDLKRRYGVTNILGHRDLYQRYGASYATYCPGPNTVNEIVHRAGGNPSAGTGGGGGGGGYTFSAKVQREQAWLISQGYDLGPDGADGLAGPKYKAAVKAYQEFLKKHWGYAGDIDGDWGGGTQTAHQKYYDSKQGKPAKPSKPSATKAPAFPLPQGSYFGPKSGPANSVSGYYSHREDLRTFQNQMIKRGWTFPKHGADGLYGDELRGNVIAFQREKGLKDVDGLVGPETWKAAWESPVT